MRTDSAMSAVVRLPLRREPAEAVSDLEAYEDLIFEAVERLARIESLIGTGKADAARRIAKDLSALAKRLGLPTLARVATDLAGARDEHATAAIAARLLRLGEESVAAAIAPDPRIR